MPPGTFAERIMANNVAFTPNRSDDVISKEGRLDAITDRRTGGSTVCLEQVVTGTSKKRMILTDQKSDPKNTDDSPRILAKRRLHFKSGNTPSAKSAIKKNFGKNVERGNVPHGLGWLKMDNAANTKYNSDDESASSVSHGSDVDRSPAKNEPVWDDTMLTPPVPKDTPTPKKGLGWIKIE